MPADESDLGKESPGRTLLHCTPQSLCSWDFLVRGEGHRAELVYRTFSEQGEVTVDGVGFEIRKHGVFSGRWTLEHQGAEVAAATKDSPFTRTFQMEDPGGQWLLCAESAFGRSFRLEHAGQTAAKFRPVHAFTRRATIEVVTPKWELPTVCFAFWLVASMWRRAAKSNNSG